MAILRFLQIIRQLPWSNVTRTTLLTLGNDYFRIPHNTFCSAPLSVFLSCSLFLELKEHLINSFEWRSNYISPHVSTGSIFRNPGKFVCGIRNHMGFGTRNTAQGIRNLTNDWNPASKLHCQRLESMQYLMWLGSWHPLGANRLSYLFYRVN